MAVRCGFLALGAILLVLLLSFPRAPLAARIMVGGSAKWTYGFNYTDWALKTGPFYQNDTLVFMYNPPSNTTFPHSVSLMKDFQGFLACDLKKAKLVGSVTQGSGPGFDFVLKKRKTYYFVCGERGGLHCTAGLMKFSVRPLRSYCHA